MSNKTGRVTGASPGGFSSKRGALMNALRNGMPLDARQVNGATQAEINSAAKSLGMILPRS